MKVRPSAGLVLVALFLVHLSLLTHLWLEDGMAVFTIQYKNTSVPAMRASGGSDLRPASPEALFCSHGTNSHKEIFFFLARVLSWNGMTVFSNDAGALSTDEGIRERVTDLLALHDHLIAGSGGVAPTIHLLGHSDGCPPSVAAKNQHPEIFNGRLGILGSFLNEPYLGSSPLLGLSGVFDQIFPTAEMREDILPPDRLHGAFVTSPWSDHFVEQYDPLLLAHAAHFFLARPVSAGSPQPLERDAGGKTGHPPISPSSRVPIPLFGVFLLLVSLVALTALTCFLAGSHVGSRGRPSLTIGFLLLGWGLFFLPAPSVLLTGWLGWFFLGLCFPFSVLRLGGRYLAGFILAMELNICLASAAFRSDLPSGLPGLLPFLVWYPVAWMAKLTLYIPSLLGKTVLTAWNIPWLLVAITAAILWKSVPRSTPKLRPIPLPTSSGPRTHLLAIALMLTAFGLWGLRFFQGMVQPEILWAVANNYLRTLFLPTVYLVGILRAAFRRPPAEEPRELP